MMENRQNSCRVNCHTGYGMNQSMNHTMNAQMSQNRQNTEACKPAAPVPCRKDLMDQINQYSFAINDIILFLDSHPNDQNAMEYFRKYRKLRMDALKEYDKYYAPLTLDTAAKDSLPWSWASEPWPWEGGTVSYVEL